MNDITSSINMRDNRSQSNSIHSKSLRRFGKGDLSENRSIRSSHSPTKLKPQNHHQNNACHIEPSKNFHIAKQHLIKTKKSRLDMLDNSQLTSFPLAPPPSSEKVTERLKSPEINAQEIPTSRPDSQLFEIDPIVLVEDYIKTKQLGRRKLSVIDLKTSLRTYESMDQIDIPQGPNYLTQAKSILSETLSIPQQPAQLSTSQTSSLLLTKCSVEEKHSIATTDFYSAKTSQSLSSACSIHTNVSNAPTLKLIDSHELTLGEFSVPSSSSLRYCVICETPLYELSSLLTQDSKYTEFVCSNCTERYEMLSKLIEDFDQSVSEMRDIPEDASMDDIEELLSQPANKKSRNDSSGFSSHLVNKLRNQLECKLSTPTTQIDRKSAIWLLEAKRKLRWRWRISGLIPHFLTKN